MGYESRCRTWRVAIRWARGNYCMQAALGSALLGSLAGIGDKFVCKLGGFYRQDAFELALAMGRKNKFRNLCARC